LMAIMPVLSARGVGGGSSGPFAATASPSNAGTWVLGLFSCQPEIRVLLLGRAEISGTFLRGAGECGYFFEGEILPCTFCGREIVARAVGRLFEGECPPARSKSSAGWWTRPLHGMPITQAAIESGGTIALGFCVRQPRLRHYHASQGERRREIEKNRNRRAVRNSFSRPSPIGRIDPNEIMPCCTAPAKIPP
jgi:hypothetical protein